MATPLRVLILEDQPADVELMLHALSQAGFAPVWQRVETERDYLAQLHRDVEVILADYALPQFDALRALQLMQERGLDIPFIMVTGAISEEVAVSCIKQGAADYLLKDRLTRLGLAVQQALREKDLRREKQYAEAALRDSEARYRTLVENSLQGMYIHQDYVIQFANPAMARIFGYDSPQELIGKDFWTLVAPHERARLEAYGRARMRGESAPPRYEFQGRHKDGTLIWLECLVPPMIPWQSKPAFMATFVDITARKQAESESQRLEAQLRQAQKMEAIGTLAGGIAHDFNNMLTAILGYTELSLDSIAQGSQVWHNLQEVLTAGQRAKDFVRQILTFSRQTEQERKPVQLHPMVKETLKLLRASLPSTIEIRQDVSEEAGMVLADPTQMQQVLMNLGTNAAYAMRATGGVLEVSLDPVAVDAILAAGHPQLRPGPYVRLTVCDTGHGMPPGVLERIWEPFFTTKGVGEGTGMGLAVVHGIVTSHEGAITATSVPGQGTTFAVYLPRIKGAAVARSHPEAPVPHGNEHILFVDDEAVLAHLGQEMLEHLGYTVTVRTSSLEALEVFRVTPQRFSLVITDQTMPNMTGETLCRELRRIRSDVPLILCTGFSHTMTEEQAKAAGIDAFLMKPFVVRDMGLVIRRVLEQHRTESGPTL